MTAVSNLANTVIANTASRALAKYVFRRVVDLIATAFITHTKILKDERSSGVPTNIQLPSSLLPRSPHDFDAEVQAPGPTIHLRSV